MGKIRNNIKLTCYIGATILMSVIVFLLLASIVYGNENNQDDFILPSWGGGMVHCDPQLTDNIRLPVPTNNVDIQWNRRYDSWAIGNGIAGNGRIAACTFLNLFQKDNLIIYDYYGNHIWTSGQWPLYNWSLNMWAVSSVPMVDINDRVIACDNQKLVLVNASNHNDVHVEWTNDIPHEFLQSQLIFSPNIIENRTIILPTKGGPLYAYDVKTGTYLAEEWFNVSLGNESFYGIREMNLSDFESIISNPLACPYHYNITGDVIEWNSSIQYGIMPMPMVFYEDTIEFITDPDGFVTAVDMTNGSEIASNYVGTPELSVSQAYYSTQNSACAKGNRTYVLTAYAKKDIRNWKEALNVTGRLYAVDVNPDAENPSDRLKIAWYYSFPGQSQASPTLINDTIYFDAYTAFKGQDDRDPHIYAVYTNGTEKWNVSSSTLNRTINNTWFSFAKDPRGGFWYEDSIQFGGRKLMRFSTENGSFIEEIHIDDLVPEEHLLPYWPFSCMTICGNETNPIMLICANTIIGGAVYAVAIDLAHNNNVSWRVKVSHIKSWVPGQYTVLMENNESRVLFGTSYAGVMAAGRYSNCWFQDIDYQLKDSNEDFNLYNDSVQVNYTIKTSLPDRVWVKATLISQQHPILCRYKTEKYYNISSVGIEDSLNVSLPPQAPQGSYVLQVFLYNSSGETIWEVLHPLEYLDFGVFANDTYNSTSPFYLYPPNDPPATPHQPWGDNQVLTNETNTYTSHTTDPNNDTIWYQWKYETRICQTYYTYYTRWITGGPYASGENYTRKIHWPYPGTYKVWLRAKDNIFNPNVMSNWSPPLQVTISKSSGGAYWDTDLLKSFTSTTVAVEQQTSCQGLAEGVIVENTQRGSLNWTWDFGDDTILYGENVSHDYTQIGNYTVNLTLKNEQGETSNFTTTISVNILKADFNTTGDAQPEKIMIFNDTSTGMYQLVNWTWDFDDGNRSYDRNTSHTYTQSREYNVTLTVKDSLNNTHVYAKPLFIESLAPEFISVVDNPDPIGFGNNVTISVDFFDNQSGVKTVKINITSPDNTTAGNYTMEQNVSSEHDYLYLYNNTWQNGVYNYSIWVVDQANNTNYVSGFNFTVSAEANITITTMKNSYTGTEYINLTDPPGTPSPSLGYELLDDGAVLHLWNQYDSYYFNTSSGIQLTNHYARYWSHNVLMLGYYNNNQWNVIYRTDELSGFNKNIETDNVSFVNVTLWKDLTYSGYAFRLAIRYHLGSYDRELTVIPYIKNLGNPIPYTLGFAWEINDIQVAMTPENDYLEINGTKFLLNESLDVTFTQLSDPAFQINEDFPNGVMESLSLRWSNSLNYRVWVKSRADEYNAPVVLGIKIGTLGIGQEKYTELLWYDACQVTYYFNHHDLINVWASNPDNMVDGNLSKYASTTIQSDVEVCDNNTCNGSSFGTIVKVDLRAFGYCSYGHRDIILQPVFNGRDPGNNYSYSPSSSPAWSGWFDITNDPGHQSLTAWSWNQIKSLDCNVTSQYIPGGNAFNLLCSKIELRVTYGNAPVISNPSPSYGTNGVSLQSWVNITVADPNGDQMNVTWYSNSTPSLLTLRPNANGSTTQLERYPTSQNANYKCIDETITNDSDYVKWKGSTWKKDTYNLPDHTNQTGTIHDVTIWARCARVGIVSYPKTDSSAQIIIRSGGNDYYGIEFKPPYSPGPPISYTNYAYTWTNNPATGSAWTWTDIDNLQAGITFIGTEGTSECIQLYVLVNYTNPLTWLQFGLNSSVGNGTFRQRFLNASVNGEWWYWKVKADDGTLSTWSSVYKFYTGYQSRIENSGDTNISGYLLMQVQFYNTSQSAWLLDNDTVNETTPQIINSGSQLGLDDFFNGKIRVSNLQHGTGTYRVYAAFKDLEGNILRTDDGIELKAWWLFTKT